MHDQRNSLVGLEQFAPSDILIGVNTAVDQLLFTGYFEESGHRIVMAEEGETILELAEETKPAVLILDFRGAGMDGPEIARRCKANPALIDIPIILCTGFIGDDSDALHAIAEGILQPFEGLAIAVVAIRLLELRGEAPAPSALAKALLHEES